MTILQIFMMILAGMALLYELSKLAMLVGVCAYHGGVHLTNGLFFGATLALLVQVLFVVSLTGVS